MQENASRQIVAALDGWRESVETMAERTFLAIYGSPMLQAAVGIDPAGDAAAAQGAQEPAAPRAPGRSASPSSRRAFRRAGCARPSIRGLLYVGMARAAVDERGFEAHAPHPRGAHRPAALRPSRRWCASSSTCCMIDQEAALAAIPSMLPADAADPRGGLRADRAGAAPRPDRFRRRTARGWRKSAACSVSARAASHPVSPDQGRVEAPAPRRS